MRVVELSHHPDAMLQEARQRRERAEAAAREALAQHQARLTEMRSRRDEARSRRQWWTWLRCVLRAWREAQDVPKALPEATEVSRRQEAVAARAAGGQQAEAALRGVFGDGWVLLRGYRNQAGGIDQLILGRRGLIAIMVAHLDATVHCDGDNWRADTYDEDGDLVGQRPIADDDGRSPGRQVGEPADLLEQLLSARGHRVLVQRVVLLTHPRSRVGDRRDSAVHIAVSADDIGALARESAVALGAGQVDSIEQLIMDDHRRGEAQRRAQH